MNLQRPRDRLTLDSQYCVLGLSMWVSIDSVAFPLIYLEWIDGQVVVSTRYLARPERCHEHLTLEEWLQRFDLPEPVATFWRDLMTRPLTLERAKMFEELGGVVQLPS